jgi:NAD(P)-dependent dehydrogenase (short-subunit alcohol dehydrogenase family)
MALLDGQVAVVIGGHSGFGLAISELFASEGAHVVIGARRIELVTEVATRLGGTPVACDITDDDQVQVLTKAALGVKGRINIAVNCAGFEQSTPLRNLTPDKLKAMHDVQIIGALYAMRHLCNAMGDGGGGAYLNLSSLTAHNPGNGLVAYASAKSGVEYAGKIAAVEYGAQHVRINAIAASLIETPMTARAFTMPQVVQALTELTPLGRMGSCDDIAKAALFLCSDMSAFITGQTLCVDGGASLTMLPSPQMYADVAGRLNAQS